MNLIRLALRKPITILVLVAGLCFFGVSAVRSIKIDIFPSLDLPVIYISHPFGGYTPTQMEAFFGKNYVNLLLYVSGVKSIETKNIQGLTLMKLSFYPEPIWPRLQRRSALTPTGRRRSSPMDRSRRLSCGSMPQRCRLGSWC